MVGKIPRRDLWLLPLVSGLTLLVLLAGTELATRAFWPEQYANSCQVPDARLGHRFQPNCSTTLKVPEGPWATETYNECGYRSATSCAPVAPGVLRVALLGSSTAEGYMVEFPDTIAARLAGDLAEACNARVDVQNLGGVGYFGPRLVPRMAEAVGLKPAAAVLIVAPFDLETLHLDEPAGPAPAPGAASTDILKTSFDAIKTSRAFTVAQHFMFRDPSLYVPLYARYGDKADFLRLPFTAAWQKRLDWFDTLLGQVQAEAGRAGIPLIVAFVPQEAQVALMAGRFRTDTLYPYALPEALAGIARKHNAGFVDTSAALLADPRPEQLYYQVDGHLSGRGQPMVAAFIAREMPGLLGGRPGSCRGPAP